MPSQHNLMTTPLVNDTLILHSGDTRVCLELSLSDDNSLEYDETFEIELRASSEDILVVNVTGNQSTMLTIMNDDSKHFTFNDLLNMEWLVNSMFRFSPRHHFNIAKVGFHLREHKKLHYFPSDRVWQSTEDATT